MLDTVGTVIQINGFPLIKFQCEENIHKLQQGKMYMSNLEWYRKHETATGDSIVGDLYEALLHVNECKIIIPEFGEEIIANDIQIPTSYTNDFVFCMLGLNSKIKSFNFTETQKEEIAKFGDTALLITDNNEFFLRIKNAANKAALNGYLGFVKYYNEHIDSANLLASLVEGMENIAFWKRDRYYYQQEFRILIHIEGATEDHIEIDIGDISDISRVLKTSTVLESIVIQQ